MKRKVNSFILYSSEGVRYRSKVNSFILYSSEGVRYKSKLNSFILYSSEGVRYRSSIKQKGASDCGLFAISAAFQSAAGLHSSILMQEKLRQHVEERFHSGEVTPFPVAANRAKNSNNTKHIVIRVYCMCKLPEEYDRHMVECEQCKTWCHYKCVGIKRKPKSFVCAPIARYSLFAFYFCTLYFITLH